MKKFWNLVKREEGSEIAEWAILFALVLLAAIALMGPIGTAIAGVWTRIATAVGVV